MAAACITKKNSLPSSRVPQALAYLRWDPTSDFVLRAAVAAAAPAPPALRTPAIAAPLAAPNGMIIDLDSDSDCFLSSLAGMQTYLRCCCAKLLPPRAPALLMGSVAMDVGCSPLAEVWASWLSKRGAIPRTPPSTPLLTGAAAC